MFTTLLLTFALFTNQPTTVPPTPAPLITTTAPEPVLVAPVTDGCEDEFSAAIKKDMVGRINDGKSSVVLDPYMGEEILLFGSRGYCRELDELGKTQTPEALSKDIIRDITVMAEENGYKITYVSKLTQVLNGSTIAIVATPSAENVASAGVDFRVLHVFVWNKTRVVGGQFFVTVTGLKTP